jgi:hypothetical protein
MRKLLALPLFLALLSSFAFAQSAPVPPVTPTTESSTDTDFFVMPGTDVTRPGSNLRLNMNVGIGHTESFLKKDPFGDELTLAYTYENGGNHGFFHSPNGSNTETLGLMKNFNVPKVKWLTGYTWPMIGLTSMTGGPNVQNRLYLGFGLGGVIHFNDHSSIWVQETWNKVVTTPWYLSTNIGYTYSFKFPKL